MFEKLYLKKAKNPPKKKVRETKAKVRAYKVLFIHAVWSYRSKVREKKLFFKTIFYNFKPAYLTNLRPQSPKIGLFLVYLAYFWY